MKLTNHVTTFGLASVPSDADALPSPLACSLLFASRVIMLMERTRKSVQAKAYIKGLKMI